MSQNLNLPLSKLRRTESVPLNPESVENAEHLDHPRKLPAQESTQTTKSPTAVESDHPTSEKKEKDPNGHKVRAIEDVRTALSKSKYLPLAATKDCGDLWFQPLEISEGGKTVSTVLFEVLLNGYKMRVWKQPFSVTNDDLLHMLYIAEMFENDYFTLKRCSYDEWYIEKYTDLLKERRNLDMTDHCTVAQAILTRENMCKLGRGTHHEVYFRKDCVHVYTGEESNENENKNLIFIKALRGKFEYIIEGRIFVISEEIHPTMLCDILEESQAPTLPSI